MNLPPELEVEVCRNMTKAELKVCRLVCKSFDKAAVPFLFDEVFVAASYSDLEIADLVVSRFGPYLRTVTLSIVDYECLPMKIFRETTRQEWKHLQKFNGRVNAHLEHAFELYCKLQTEHLQIHKSGELLARLSVILSKSPKVGKMILTDCGNKDIHHQSLIRPHDPWRQDDLCPFKKCELSVLDHLGFHVRPRPPHDMLPNPFHLAMLAISAAKSTVTEFTMVHDLEYKVPSKMSYISKHAFKMTTQEFYCVTSQLQHLTKLRIRLRDEGEETRAVARALSYGVNLESLVIEGLQDDLIFTSESDTTMFMFLGGCRFPKLRSLVLQEMDSRDEELLDFLEASPCLNHLTLDFFFLRVGSWNLVAERVRSTLRLKSVAFKEVIDDEAFKDIDQDLIDNFFLRNGENPFRM